MTEDSKDKKTWKEEIEISSDALIAKIKDLAAELPDMSDQLLALNARVVDLLPVVRKNYYPSDMPGSWAMKKVLPSLVPELSYADLGSVQDGTQAQSTYLAVIGDEVSAEERRQLEADLIEYCKLDTYAMVMMVESLCEMD